MACRAPGLSGGGAERTLGGDFSEGNWGTMWPLEGVSGGVGGVTMCCDQG